MCVAEQRAGKVEMDDLDVGGKHVGCIALHSVYVDPLFSLYICLYDRESVKTAVQFLIRNSPVILSEPGLSL